LKNVPIDKRLTAEILRYLRENKCFKIAVVASVFAAAQSET
jgi:hypothetical protein